MQKNSTTRERFDVTPAPGVHASALLGHRRFPKPGAACRLQNPLMAGSVVAVRVPTDTQYSEMYSRFESVRGRPDDELAAVVALFDEIALEACGIEPATANYLLGRMLRFDLLTARVDGTTGGFVVRAEVLGGVEVSIRFRLPYPRGLARFDDTFGFEGAVALFDQLAVVATGYEGPVPNYHKFSAVVAMRLALSSEVGSLENVDFCEEVPGSGDSVKRLD